MKTTRGFLLGYGIGLIALLANAASGGDNLKIPLPPVTPSVAPLNIQVLVTADRVLDQRHFEDQPKSADIPSLAGGMERAGAATTTHAIGRARNGFGKAMQNVYLDDDGLITDAEYQQKRKALIDQL